MVLRAWLQRWHPLVLREATVYVARRCGVCSAVRRLFEARSPSGLQSEDAESLLPGSITRMRYVCGKGTVEGVHAIARAL